MVSLRFEWAALFQWAQLLFYQRFVYLQTHIIQLLSHRETFLPQKTCKTLYFVDDFEPEKYYNISEYVMLPVYIKAYIKRNNQASYTICTRKDYQTRGEAFWSISASAATVVGADVFRDYGVFQDYTLCLARLNRMGHTCLLKELCMVRVVVLVCNHVMCFFPKVFFAILTIKSKMLFIVSLFNMQTII